ncbi:MAG: gamma-glutamylcyclotransferase family protein [Microscillaceae bacterium]|nr:gamma-glutamylcyclotransferase family protein [Microscillaceae bacterium]
MPKLFVYGTLRRGGYYHHLMQEALLIQEVYPIRGYELRYSGAHYPYAFINPDCEIIGDIFEVSQALLEGPLDALEDVAGGEYQRYFDEANDFYIYLKVTDDREVYDLIEHGDWLEYWKRLNTY